MRKAIKDKKYTLDDDYYYLIIGENIKKYRTSRNLTQQDLADMTDISRDYICDVENEKRNKHITITRLGRISEALEVDITNFFIKHNDQNL